MWLLGMVEAIIEDLGIPAVLRGSLTQSNGAAVLSTTLPRHTSCGQAREQRIKEKRWVLRCGVQRRREGRQRNGVKNLHLSKTIPNS
jgi:hypothetical protein